MEREEYLDSMEPPIPWVKCLRCDQWCEDPGHDCACDMEHLERV